MERNGFTWRFQQNWDTVFCVKILENKLYYQIGQWQSVFRAETLYRNEEFLFTVFQGIEKGNILKAFQVKTEWL